MDGMMNTVIKSIHELNLSEEGKSCSDWKCKQ